MRVDVGVRLEVVRLDTVKVGCVLESWVVPVQVLHPLVDEWVAIPDGSVVALEVEVVDRVEPDNGCKETNVGLGKLIGVEVGSSIAQDLLHTVERFEEWANVGFVGLLSSGKAALVDAVVDVRVDPFVEAINLFGMGFGVVCDTFELFRDEVVESGVEVSDDFRRLVVDDCVELGVPDDRDCATLVVIRIGSEVKLPDSFLVLMTWNQASSSRNALESLGLFIGHERPSFRAEEGVHNTDREEVGHSVDALELAHNQSTMSPGTGKSDNEVVTSNFGFVLAALLDGGSEARFLTTEVAVFVGPIGRAVLLRVVSRHVDRCDSETTGRADSKCAIEMLRRELRARR